jgi:hypothetical protein
VLLLIRGRMDDGQSRYDCIDELRLGIYIFSADVAVTLSQLFILPFIFIYSYKLVGYVGLFKYLRTSEISSHSNSSVNCEVPAWRKKTNIVTS